MYTYLNVQEVFGQHGRAVVDGLSLPVELATQHLCADRHLEHVACELAMSVRVVNVSSTFEDLNKSAGVNSLEPRTNKRTRALFASLVAPPS